MLAKAFVVAMAADIARSDYAKPTLIRSRSREWLIACRWGPDGEYLSIATAGVIRDPRGLAAPDAIAPIHSLFGVLVSESQAAASTFFAGTIADPDRACRHFFPADGYALLQQRRPSASSPRLAIRTAAVGWTAEIRGIFLIRRPLLGGGDGVAHRGEALRLDWRVYLRIHLHERQATCYRVTSAWPHRQMPWLRGAYAHAPEVLHRRRDVLRRRDARLKISLRPLVPAGSRKSDLDSAALTSENSNGSPMQMPSTAAIRDSRLAPALDGIFLFGCPKSKDAPSLRIYRGRYRLLGRGGKKILKNEPTLVREPKYPAHQLEEPRLLPDIQQFEKFRDRVMSQSREKPFGFVDQAALV